MKLKSLKDLQHIQQKLVEEQKLAAARETARVELELKAAAERDLFVRAAGAVNPMRAHHRRVHLAPDQPPPIPVQQ